VDIEAAKRVVEEEFAQPAVVWCKVCHSPKVGFGDWLPCRCATPGQMRALRRAAKELPGWQVRYDVIGGGRMYMIPKKHPWKDYWPMHKDEPIGCELVVRDGFDFPQLADKTTTLAKWYACWDEDPLEGDYVASGRTPLEVVRKIRKHLARVAAYYAKLAKAPTKETK